MAVNLNYMTGQQNPMDVQIAPVDRSFMVPTMGEMQPQQSNPERDYLKSVLSEYAQSKQNQQSNNGITEQILANRFQPTMQDRAAAISQTNAAFGAPDLFKAITPEEAMGQRYAMELSPYTSMLEAQGKLGTNMMNQAGGATGILMNRLKAENPGMTDMQALQMVQTGFRNNTMMDAQGNIVPMQGALGTVSALSNAKQTGQNISDLQYKPQIAGGEAQQRQAAELKYAAPIEAQKKVGAGEITEVQKREQGQQQMAATVDSMINKYKTLQSLGGTTSTGNTIGQNLAARAKNTAIGQGIQNTIGTQEQAVRNEINMSIPALINDIRSATGMSAKAMDSNTELQFYLQMATNPRVNVEANIDALNTIKKKYLAPLPGQQKTQVPSNGATHIWNPATGTAEPIQ